MIQCLHPLNESAIYIYPPLMEIIHESTHPLVVKWVNPPMSPQTTYAHAKHTTLQYRLVVGWHIRATHDFPITWFPHLQPKRENIPSY